MCEREGMWDVLKPTKGNANEIGAKQKQIKKLALLNVNQFLSRS